MVMMKNSDMPKLLLPLALCAVVATPPAQAQNKPAQPNATASPTPQDAQSSNRAQSYYHAALAEMYEEQAVNSGRPEFVQHAIEEYKAAINADPTSAQLYDGLADLYFRTG